MHANSFGAGFKDNPQVEDYTVVHEDWGITATSTYKDYTKPKGLFNYFFGQKRSDLQSRFTFYLPNITKVESSSDSIRIVNYAIHFPVDENTTISKRILFRNFARYRWLDGRFMKYYNKIYAEDSRVSESQYPRMIPDSLVDEVHIASDALQIAYRKLRQQYLAMGWGVQPAQHLVGHAHGQAVVNGHTHSNGHANANEHASTNGHSAAAVVTL